MKQNGFEVEVEDLPDLVEVKAELGVPLGLSGCHTATIDGYVVEGHVPADVIRRLLAERPDIVGLTVPGMPAGSPGMEAAGSEPYDILTFAEDGSTTVYESR